MNYHQLKKIVLDLLFPVNCLGCGWADVWLCQKCLKNIRRFRQVVSLPEPNWLDEVVVAASFSDPLVRRAIHSFKYQMVEDLGPVLVRLFQPEIGRRFKDYCLTPIPLSRKRLRFREFNQAEVLARALTKRFNLPLATNLLIRIKDRPTQASLKRAERLENIKNIFTLSQPLGSAKQILLVDDVATTGATLNEAARVLKKAGA
ncbi:MAG: ComF family protein, partial [Patescibacteria group bacterium]